MTTSALTPVSPRSPRSKTWAAWLALVLGPLGIHRMYLHGSGDWLAWLHPIPTALGLLGVDRVLTYGQDDKLSWVLIPLLGFTLAATSLTAIVYALTDQEKWNARHNPEQPKSTAGQTHWLTIFALVFALLLGATALMGSLAFSFQRYFEYQVDEARKISQGEKK